MSLPAKKSKKPTSITSRPIVLGRKSVEVMVKKKVQKKKEWNDYLTEDNRFRASPEEILRRKQLLVSKHNILSDQYQPPKLKSKIKSLKSQIQNITKSEKRRSKSGEDNQDSLDLLELESDSSEVSDDDQDYVQPDRVTIDRFEREYSVSEVRPSSSRRKKSTALNRLHSQSKPFISPKDKIPDEDLSNISKELQLLFQELRYYEELAGKRSIINSQELTDLLPEDELNENLDQKKVLRVLVNLVCQTMTYLLKSEVDKEMLQTEINSLKERLSEQEETAKSTPTIIPSSKQCQQELLRTPAIPTSPSKENVPPVSHSATKTGPLSQEPTVRKNLDALFEDSGDYPMKENRRPPLSSSSSSLGNTLSTKPTAAMTVPETPMTPTTPNFAFNGSSPTDLLFSPDLLAKFHQQAERNLSRPMSENKSGLMPLHPPFEVERSHHTANHNFSNSKTEHNDQTATPVQSYEANDLSTYSTRTQDLLTAGYDDVITTHQRSVTGKEGREEEEDLSFDYDSFARLKSQYLLNPRDSSESTIERLSLQYANSVHLKTQYHPYTPPSMAPTQTPTRVVISSKMEQQSEQPSITSVPNSAVPIPVQAPLHPFAMTHRSTSDGLLKPMKQAPLTIEKKIYDARYGSF